jgi:hypothetical protein
MVPVHFVLYQIMETNVLQKVKDLFALAKALPTNGVFFRGDGPQFRYEVNEEWLLDILCLICFSTQREAFETQLQERQIRLQEDVFVFWLNYRDHTTLFTTKKAELQRRPPTDTPHLPQGGTRG